MLAECDAAGASVAKVAMSPPANACAIRIELRRGPTAMTITWPVEASSACASWMRELLR